MVISVVIPTFNRAEKLTQTIKSIEKSSLSKEKFEILIVDDASTEKTNEVVDNLQIKFKNINYLRQKKNKGPAAARNLGIQRSKGRYIFFTDDDCLVPINWLKDYSAFLDSHKYVWGAGGPLKPASSNLIAKLEKIKDSVLGINNKREIIGGEELQTCFTNNVVYRRETFKRIGLFNEKFKLPSGEDVEFKNRVARKYKIAYLPISVIHNHEYNLDYFLGITIKQGLGKMPPKNLFYKIFTIIFYSPFILVKTINKIIFYRKNK